MNVVRFSRGGQRTQSAALLLACTIAVSAPPVFAQVTTLRPGAFVEVVDPSERISGNAAAGIVLVGKDDTIGSDRLWAYLPEGITAKLKLRISSVDGRYYAEIDYEPAGLKEPWVALELPLSKFGFLDSYENPMNEIAALLSDAEDPIFYPLRWGDSHLAPDAKSPKRLEHTDALRVYMNTERAQAFVVVDNAPALCRAASEVSGFKFNAICELTLRDLLASESGSGGNVVGRVEVLRRSGVSMLKPLALDVRIRY